MTYDPKSNRILDVSNGNSPQTKALKRFTEVNRAKETYAQQLSGNVGTFQTSGVKCGKNPVDNTAVAQNVVFTSKEVKEAQGNIKSAIRELELEQSLAQNNKAFAIQDNTKVNTPSTNIQIPEKKTEVDIGGVKMNLTRTQLDLLSRDPQALAGLISLKQVFDKSPSQGKIIAAIHGEHGHVHENNAMKNLAIAAGIQGGEKATVATAKLISKEAEHFAHNLVPKLAGPVDLALIAGHMSHSLPEALKGDGAATAAFGLQCAEGITVAAITAGAVSGGVGTVAVLAISAAAELCMEISESGKQVEAWKKEQKGEIAHEFAEQMLEQAGHNSHKTEK